MSAIRLPEEETTAHIAAIVTIEPGGAPSKDSAKFQALTAQKIPAAFFCGDCIDNGDPAIPATVMWQMMRQSALDFGANCLNAGAPCTFYNLPAPGITGNDHFKFENLNRAQIQDLVGDWIQQNLTQP